MECTKISLLLNRLQLPGALFFYFPQLADTCAFNHWLNPFYFHMICITKFWSATDSEWVTKRGDDRLEASRQSGRPKQPENMGKEDLLTVFVPCGRVQPDMDLFELWRLVGSRVTLGEEEEEEKEMKRGWEEWKTEKLTAKSHRDIVWNREQVMGKTTGDEKKHGWKKQKGKSKLNYRSEGKSLAGDCLEKEEVVRKQINK